MNSKVDEKDELNMEKILQYIGKNLKISIEICGYNDHKIRVALILDGEEIDSDELFVSRWTSGY